MSVVRWCEVLQRLGSRAELLDVLLDLGRRRATSVDGGAGPAPGSQQPRARGPFPPEVPRSLPPYHRVADDVTMPRTLLQSAPSHSIPAHAGRPYILGLRGDSASAAGVSAVAAPLDDRGVALLRLADANRVLPSAPPPEVFAGHTERVHDVCFVPASGSNVLFSCGEDSLVLGFDARTGLGPVHRVQAPRAGGGAAQPLLASVDVGLGGGLLAVGTEEEEDEDARVLFWDIRKLAAPLAQYRDAHTAAVTQVRFDPLRPNMLATASLDGLMCWFDITLGGEGDAMQSVLNTDSPVARIGFVPHSVDTVYIITHAETCELWNVESAEKQAWFDRSALGAMGQPADYLVDLLVVDGSALPGPGDGSPGLALLSGSNDGSIHLAQVASTGRLVPLGSVSGSTTRLGHSGVVRGGLLCKSASRMVTAGEDGLFCEWELDWQAPAESRHGYGPSSSSPFPTSNAAGSHARRAGPAATARRGARARGGDAAMQRTPY